jgi:hypothetical protein
LEKLAALVPLPRMHLVRSGGCLAPHSHLREAIIPTPRQQGMTDEAPDAESPRWRWARLLKRVVALDMARCPFCQQGTWRIIAALTPGEVIRTILQPLKLAVDPPPIAPARVRQQAFAWSSACGPLAYRCGVPTGLRPAHTPQGILLLPMCHHVGHGHVGTSHACVPVAAAVSPQRLPRWKRLCLSLLSAYRV